MASSSEESACDYMTRGRRYFFSPPSPTILEKMKQKLKDLQKEKPRFEIEINKVGVTNLILPLKIKYDKKINHVIANVCAFVNLPAKERGTHMSRMIKILHNASSKEINPEQISLILTDLKKELNADKSYLTMEFVLFKTKESPITKNKGFINHKCFINACQDVVMNLRLGTEVLITSLCPISKSISKYSAHNQRGKLTAEVLCNGNELWFGNLIDMLNSCGSCELFSLLKREDEKFVTERAYENPKIVEDIIRDVAFLMKKNKYVKEFKISCENFESIHTHNAYSEITMKNAIRNRT
jgi:GTP cyclohydrolase I